MGDGEGGEREPSAQRTLAGIVWREACQRGLECGRCERPSARRRPIGRQARGREKHGRSAAVHADPAARRHAEEPRRHRADASVFGGQGLCHRLAPDECRQVRGRRRGAGDHGVDQGRAARLRHRRRPRHLEGRFHPGPETLRRVHPQPWRGARHPARPFRAQGAPLPAVGGRSAAQAVARDRRLGGLGAGGAERAGLARDRSGAPRAVARGDPEAGGGVGPGRAARPRGRLRGARRARRARLPDPRVPVAVRQPPQRRVRRDRAQPHALLHRGDRGGARALAAQASRCSCGCRWRTTPAGGPSRAWRWPASSRTRAST